MRNSPPCSPRAGRGRITSEARRSAGIRVRGRFRESELLGTPPHPICFASQGLRSQIYLSPHAGRDRASGLRVVLQIIAALALACFSLAAHGQNAPDFYKGKQIQLIVGYEAGNDYDLGARM